MMSQESMQKEGDPFSNPTIRELNDKFKPFWALKRSEALLEWDLEVNMPEKASSSRGFILGQLALLDQVNIASLYPILEKARQIKDLNDQERGVVRILEYLKKFYTKIPPSLLEEEKRVAVRATVAWRESRKKSDFKSFQPHLEKIIDLKLQEAEKLGYEKHPYNALLDLYEEQVTVEDMDRMYSRLIPALKRILEKVRSEKRYVGTHVLESEPYQIENLEKVNRRLTEILGIPKDRFRMDVSTHPFMTNISRDDVRITTRYEGTDFAKSTYGTIHESGHGIYELQLNEKLEYTPIGIAASTGFHESQSRFWENIVGRSKAFVSLISPMLKDELNFLAKYNDEELYRYFNRVRPSMVRVEADELTYNFHTALRYEIEKKLLAGNIRASELPSIWNDTMDDYLGIRPKNDTEGVLQDIHWSGGSLGYFPTYSLGNVIAGMIWYNMRNEIDLDKTIRNGDFAPIKAWLYEKIHKYGATYTPKELSKRSLGESFNPDRLVQYLEWKYVS
ncbi:MAG: carboxypeptidase M32 [archaeon]|nr:carboxypeptidase M32 [archaeon]